MLSFYAPYVCDSCRTQFQAVIDAYVHRDALTSRTPPPMKCPKCGSDARYDGSLEAFAAACEKVEPKRERSIPNPGDPQIERHAGDGGTRLVLLGELATTLRWRSALDGLDGELVLDLSRATSVAQGGVAPLLIALRASAPSLSRITMHGVPLPLAVALRMDPIRHLTITSVVVEGQCGSCATLRRAAVDVVGGRWEESVGRGVSCPKCGKRLDVGKTLDDVPQRSFPLGMLLAGSAALAVFATVLVVAGLVMAGYTAAGRAEAPPEKAEASERLILGDEVVSASGRGGPFATRMEAESAARDQALGVLISALGREIASRRGASTGALDVTHEQVQQFAEVVPEAAAAAIESKVTEGDGGFEVEARYGVPRATFDRVAKVYAEETVWGGLTLVRTFPPGPGLKVVKSEVDGIEPGSRITRVGGADVNLPGELPPGASGVPITVVGRDGTERGLSLP